MLVALDKGHDNIVTSIQSKPLRQLIDEFTVQEGAKAIGKQTMATF